MSVKNIIIQQIFLSTCCLSSKESNKHPLPSWVLNQLKSKTKWGNWKTKITFIPDKSDNKGLSFVCREVGCSPDFPSDRQHKTGAGFLPQGQILPLKTVGLEEKSRMYTSG